MNGQQDLALALQDLRRELAVTTAETRGQLQLLAQRNEQSERQQETFGQAVRAMDERVDRVEREQVTRPQLDERARRTIAVLGVLVAAVSTFASIATTVVIAVVGR